MTGGGQSLVVACSALKQRYRDVLRGKAASGNSSGNSGGITEFVYLKGDFELLQGRLSARKDHFFNPNLLRSQFEALEPPTDAAVIDIDATPDEIADRVILALGLNGTT